MNSFWNVIGIAKLHWKKDVYKRQIHSIMQKNLVIVESPAKAKTIEKFLGNDYKVQMCIRDRFMSMSMDTISLR